MKYDWKKTAEKAGWGLLYATITGLIVWKTSDPRWVAILPLLMAAQNYLKHKVLV